MVEHKNIKLRLSLGFVVLAILIVAGVYGFYAYADAAGAREWAETKKSLEAAGDNLDFASYIPPKIPDDQNLAAIPLFRVETNTVSKSRSMPGVEDAYRNYREVGSPPTTGSMEKGELPDQGIIEKWVSDGYRKLFPKESQTITPLEKIDAIFPVVKELSEAAKTRPLCRFEIDYTTMPTFKRSYPELMAAMDLVKILRIHARVALMGNHPEIALDDIKLGLQLNSGMWRGLTLIHGLVAVAVSNLHMAMIWDGLNRHAWNDSQLAELQQCLKGIDCLNNFQLSLRGESTGMYMQTIDCMRDDRETGAQLVTVLSQYADDYNDLSIWGFYLYRIWPKGTFDMAKARGLSFYMEATHEFVDPAKDRVFPEKLDQMQRKIGSQNRYAFPNLLVRITVPHVIISIEKFSEGQFHVDAAIIACALERYCLAHGAYPASLDDLAPYSDGPLPHDLMNGEPYHYKLQPDGKYLLYSVGWNQIDEGGKVVYLPSSSPNPSIDWKQGDWVWPCAKDAPHK